jgi:hypothetical protein
MAEDFEAKKQDLSKRFVTDMCVKYGIASSLTSLVAVSEERVKNVENMELEEIRTKQTSVRNVDEELEALEDQLSGLRGMSQAINQEVQTQNIALSRIEAQVCSTKSIMVDNIDQMLCRGETIDNLVAKTDFLEADSHAFFKNSASLNHSWFGKAVDSVSSWFSSVDSSAPPPASSAPIAWGASAPTPVPVPLTLTLEALIESQRFDGSFDFEKIGKFFSFDIVNSFGVDELIFHTAFCLAVLSFNFPDDKLVWRFVYNKGLGFVGNDEELVQRIGKKLLEKK